MRPCSQCVSRNLLCVVSASSDHCEQCARTHRQCELAPPAEAIIKRLSREEDRILNQIQEKRRVALKTDAAVTRLRKQRRAVQKKLRDLRDKEMQNILELEAKETLENAPSLKPFSIPPSLNFFQVSRGSPNRTPASPFRSG